MNGTDFCFWCGFSSRNRRGHCTICYPDGYLFPTQKAFLAHVLYVRNTSVSQDLLNTIREGIEPNDIRKDRRYLVRVHNDIPSSHIAAIPTEDISHGNEPNDNSSNGNVSGSDGSIRSTNVLINIAKLRARLRRK